MKKLLVTLAIIILITQILACAEGSNDASGGAQTGSLASMTVLNDRLHILDQNQIVSFDVSSGTSLGAGYESVTRFWGATTIMPYKGKYLLIGTDSSVEVVHIVENTDGSTQHEYVSGFQHIVAYDPVVAQGDIAVYTISDGNGGRFSSRRDVVGVLNMENIENPELITENETLIEPYGLGIVDDSVFVCDKSDGLIELRLQKDEQQQIVSLDVHDYHSEYTCNDLIISNDLLILTGSDSVTQLKRENDQLSLLSRLYF